MVDCHYGSGSNKKWPSVNFVKTCTARTSPIVQSSSEYFINKAHCLTITTRTG